MNGNINKGIILMNLGSPDSTKVGDVQKYLDEFLMDKRVIDAPYLLRALLVKGIIVPFRSPKSAKAYASIWTKDGSPLVVLTKQLQTALQAQVSATIEVAMRYGNPSAEAAFNNLMHKVPNLQEVLLVPLYPHYAMSSYETAVAQMQAIYQKNKYNFKLTIIPPFYNNNDYIAALAKSIEPYLQDDFDKIIFSYHSIPERHIKNSDTTGCHCLKVNDCCHIASAAHAHCYRHQTVTTTEMVIAKLGLPQEKVEQTFQSRLGRDKWLTPFTAERLAALPKEGVKKILVVCPSFVSDCLETLEEMNDQGREIFEEAGGHRFTLIPCMNLHPLWVSTLAKWVHVGLIGNKETEAAL